MKGYIGDQKVKWRSVQLLLILLLNCPLNDDSFPPVGIDPFTDIDNNINPEYQYGVSIGNSHS